ncbi:SDR family oxidoreductase [Pseudomaricurvus sp.]|uniref:SDR family oxidoreductase n=1 Tax=Pseudomaricurvus sp. TaxID=2004510 RepID=UPI003F6B7C67
MSDQKVALVTNAREYAGPGSVAALLDDGFFVLCHDKSFVDELVRKEFSQEFSGAIPLAEQCPVALVEAVMREKGRVDVLVSNDVIHSNMKPIETATVDEYREAIEGGMVWPFLLANAVVPQMKERQSGALIFVTSGAALAPYQYLSMYSSARAGAVALSQSLAKELGPFNIQVNAICPNWFKSDTYFSDKQLAEYPKLAERITKEVPIKRLGQQHEMGELVSLLASQKAMPMTGQAIAFDGGFYP